jgi:hypothetical protein
MSLMPGQKVDLCCWFQPSTCPKMQIISIKNSTGTPEPTTAVSHKFLAWFFPSLKNHRESLYSM